MGLHGPAWACMGLHGLAWASVGLRGPAWACMGLHGQLHTQNPKRDFLIASPMLEICQTPVGDHLNPANPAWDAL